MYTTYSTYMYCVFVCRFSQKLWIVIARTDPCTFMCMYIYMQVQGARECGGGGSTVCTADMALSSFSVDYM